MSLWILLIFLSDQSPDVHRVSSVTFHSKKSCEAARDDLRAAAIIDSAAQNLYAACIEDTFPAGSK